MIKVKVKSLEELKKLLELDSMKYPNHTGWEKLKDQEKFCDKEIEVKFHQGNNVKKNWYVHLTDDGKFIYFRKDFLIFDIPEVRTKLPDLKWKLIYTPDKHGLVELRGKMYCADKANCDCKFPDLSNNYQDHLGDLMIKLDMLEKALTEEHYDPDFAGKKRILTLAGERVSVFFNDLRNIIDGLKG